MDTLGVRADGEASPRQSVAQIVELLERALELSDESGVRPEIGARLQEIIDALKDEAV